MAAGQRPRKREARQRERNKKSCDFNVLRIWIGSDGLALLGGKRGKKEGEKKFQRLCLIMLHLWLIAGKSGEMSRRQHKLIQRFEPA